MGALANSSKILFLIKMHILNLFVRENAFSEFCLCVCVGKHIAHKVESGWKVGVCVCLCVCACVCVCMCVCVCVS